MAAGVVFIAALGHFETKLGWIICGGSFVVVIACLIASHLLDSDERA